MTHRLQEMGIEKSLDMIVRSDESIKIGDKIVSMRDILEKINAENSVSMKPELQNSKQLNWNR